MIKSNSLGLSVARAAVGRLNSAREVEPHPLYGRRDEVLRYIKALQEADRALSEAQDALGATTVSLPEIELLARRRAAADTAVSRHVALVARRLSADRHEAVATLNGIFELGTLPQPPVSGRYAGQLITSTLVGPLDSFGRFMARLWVPWKGKRFSPEASTGDNIFSAAFTPIGRVYWPTYSGYEPYAPGLVTAFPFRTYSGPGAQDPGVQVLKIDYDSPSNPRFIVRRTLDELVQITGNYYLGKAHLRGRHGRYRLAAFFALQKER